MGIACLDQKMGKVTTSISFDALAFEGVAIS